MSAPVRLIEKPIIFVTEQAKSVMAAVHLDMLRQASCIHLIELEDGTTQTPDFVDKSLENSALGAANHVLVAFDTSKGDMVAAAHRHHVTVMPATQPAENVLQTVHQRLGLL